MAPSGAGYAAWSTSANSCDCSASFFGGSLRLRSSNLDADLMSYPLTHSDPGLQPERTTLAWARTTVSYAVSSAILLRWIPHFGIFVAGLIFLMVITALGIYASQRSRHRASVQGLVAGKVQAAVGAVLILTLGMTIFGVSGIVLILTT